MSKPLKVQDDVYQELDGLRRGRLTFSDVIDELLQLRRQVVGMVDKVWGSSVLSPGPLAKLPPAAGQADDSTADSDHGGRPAAAPGGRL